MRLIHYYVINKVTGNKVNVGCYKSNADKAIADKPDPENYYIGYKWLSI